MADLAEAASHLAAPVVLPTRTGRRAHVTVTRPPIPEGAEARYSGNRIRSVLEWRGLRLPWVADRMRYHRTYVARVVAGDRPLTDEFIARACDALDLPPDALFIEAPPVAAAGDGAVERVGDAPPPRP